jgi:hypothetical protein
MAIVGADGSGKTTLTRDLAAWLGRKIQTDHIYFGQPKRNATVTALRRGSQLLRRVGSHVEELGFGGVARRLRTAADLIQSVLWVHLARRRQRLDRTAWRERKRGGVILAERFPLRAFWGMAAPMDGPRLDPDDPRGPLFRRMAGLEHDRYVRVRSPDSVIILNARLKILRERKPETPPLEHKAKAQAVAEAVLCEDHLVIDAEQPYERMLLEGKRLVWGQLLSTAGAPARSARLAAEIPAGRTP